MKDIDKLLRVENYESNYIDLPFENILRDYRKQNLLGILNRSMHSNILEIGCGPNPIFEEFSDYTQMVVVEPGELFYRKANEKADSNPKIVSFNNVVENIVDELSRYNFDFIIIGGFLHEIDNPGNVLQAVRSICSRETIVYSFVPNAKSFHRLLAFEMGLIESIYTKSSHDILFQRQDVFDINGFNDLLTKNNFRVLESGSYFIKPFTHNQMNNLLDLHIIDKSCLDGLNRLTEYLPEYGAELWNICNSND